MAALNAADETLIARFLRKEIPYPGIAAGLQVILERWKADRPDQPITLGEITTADKWARAQSAALCYRAGRMD